MTFTSPLPPPLGTQSPPSNRQVRLAGAARPARPGAGRGGAVRPRLRLRGGGAAEGAELRAGGGRAKRPCAEVRGGGLAGLAGMWRMWGWEDDVDKIRCGVTRRTQLVVCG